MIRLLIVFYVALVTTSIQAQSLNVPDNCNDNPLDFQLDESVRPEQFTNTHSYFDVISNRHALIDSIWGTGDLPTKKQPNSTEVVLKPFPFGNFKTAFVESMNPIRELRIETGNGYVAHAYYFTPKLGNNRLAIINMGHASGLGHPDAVEGTIIRRLVERKFSVLYLPMPLTPPNTGPAATHDHIYYPTGEFTADTMVQNPEKNALRHFMEPILVSINYALSQDFYTDISMFGASGGGWATVLYAALDERVTTSIQVGGSLPLYLRTTPCGAPYKRGSNSGDFGDAEQQPQGALLFDQISYLDLYIMAATGLNRRHIQYLSEHDPKSFSGTRYLHYASYLENLVENIGGKFYATHNHWVEVHGYPRKFGSYDDWEIMMLLPVLELPNTNPYRNLQTIDDADSHFNAPGWIAIVGKGYDSDSYQKPASTELSATWTFNVEPDRYRMALSWVASAELSDRALYVVKSGNVELTRFELNQKFPPNKLGWYVIEESLVVPNGASELTIELSGMLNEKVNADAVSIWTENEHIVDNEDEGFFFYSENHSTMVEEARAYKNNVTHIEPGSFDSYAEWNFVIQNGTYFVYATWPAAQQATTESRFEVFDPCLRSPVATRDFDQRLEPSEIELESGRWSIVASNVTVTSESLRVTLRNLQHTGLLYADAIRVVRIQ